MYLAKPTPRRIEKARRKRREGAVVKSVRPQVVVRDGYCRMANKGLGPCGGNSEWAHLGESKRFKTRGMEPELRHTTAGSLMACTTHHTAYDKGRGDGRLHIKELTERRADGPLRFTRGQASYEEQE